MYASNNNLALDGISRNNGSKGILNLSGIPTDQALARSKNGETYKVDIHSKAGQIVCNVSKKANELVILRPSYTVLRMVQAAIKNVLIKLEDRIGDWKGADFEQKYSEEDIYKLALAYPRSRKPTYEAIMEFYDVINLSKRQAGKIRTEILDSYPHSYVLD